MLENPWVSLQLHISNNTLYMKLLNGKAEQAPTNKPGIGLQNVKERLQLLYPGEHELPLINDPDVFIVNLKITLQQFPVAETRLLKEKTPAHV